MSSPALPAAIADEAHMLHLKVAAHAVQHLELEPVRCDAVLGGPPPGEIDHRGIVRGDGRVGPVRQQDLQIADSTFLGIVAARIAIEPRERGGPAHFLELGADADERTG